MKVLFFLLFLTLTSCSLYRSQGRECVETKSNCAAVDLPDAFTQSVAVNCSEPLDATLEISNVKKLKSEIADNGGEILDWLGYSQSLELWLLHIGEEACVYFYNNDLTLMNDYRESIK